MSLSFRNKMLHTEKCCCVCARAPARVCYDKHHSFFCEVCWYVWSHATGRIRWFL